jgi:hypothetical protein
MLVPEGYHFCLTQLSQEVAGASHCHHKVEIAIGVRPERIPLWCAGKRKYSRICSWIVRCLSLAVRHL